MSGSTGIFVDQAAQDGFSVDPFAVEVGNGEVATVVFVAGGGLVGGRGIDAARR